MSGPIFIYAAQQLHLFASAEEATAALEPDDLRSGKLEIFDRSGARLRATINLAKPAFCAPTNQIHLVLVAQPSEPADRDRLRALIAVALDRTDGGEAASLESLVDALVAQSTP